jgi:hypothetical protein
MRTLDPLDLFCEYVKTVILKSPISKVFDPSQPRDDHGRWTNGMIGIKRDMPPLFGRDNLGSPGPPSGFSDRQTVEYESLRFLTPPSPEPEPTNNLKGTPEQPPLPFGPRHQGSMPRKEPLMAPLFHGTSAQAFESIKKEGLIPKAGKGADEWAVKHGYFAQELLSRDGVMNSVFLSKDINQAEKYAQLAAEVTGSKPVLIAVNVPVKEVKAGLFRPMPDVGGDSISGLRVQAKIKPEWIADHYLELTPDNSYAQRLEEVKVTRGLSRADGDTETYYMVILVDGKDNTKKEKVNLSSMLKLFNPNEERDWHGRWTSGGVSAEEAAAQSFKPDVWRSMGMSSSREAWGKLSMHDQDEMANASVTVKRLVDQMSAVHAWPNTGNPELDIAQRVNQYKGEYIAKADAPVLRDFGVNAYQAMLAAGASREDAAALSRSMVDHVLAQDFEALGRTLGNHGIRHLNGDAVMANTILATIPGNNDTPLNRALNYMAAAYHDTGYLTPPSRVFLDEQHPHWSMQYYQANLKDTVERVFGKDAAGTLQVMIGGHTTTAIDWASRPSLSSFATADNLGLFQAEKLPSVLRDVSQNIKTMTDLATGVIGVDEARSQMSANIKSSNLSSPMKTQALEAVGEVSGVLPKFTLGMLGSRVDSFSWKDSHLHVEIAQTNANEHLAKVIDFGQQQFKKFAATFHADADKFLQTKELHFTFGGKEVLSAHIRRVLKALLSLLLKGDLPGHEFRGNQWTSGGAPDTPEFKEWFSGSVVIGSNGEPMRVYHGTDKNISSFEERGLPWHYFSDNPKFAEKFAVSDEPMRIPPSAPKTPPDLQVKIKTTQGDMEKPAWSTGVPGLVVLEQSDGRYNVTHQQSGLALGRTSVDFNAVLESASKLGRVKGVDFTQNADALKGLAPEIRSKLASASKFKDPDLGSEPDPIAAMFGYKGKEGMGVGSNVVPAFLSIKNPVDLTELKARGHQSPNALISALDKYGIKIDHRDLPVAGRDLYQMLNIEDVAHKIKNQAAALGYDGVVFKDYYDPKTRGTTYIAFRPEQIKSVFNQRPTSSPDIGKVSLASLLKYDDSQPRDERGRWVSGAGGEPSHIFFEVAPDPNNSTLTERWNKLTVEEKIKVSDTVANRIAPSVMHAANVTGTPHMQIGGYEGATNPSFAIDVPREEDAAKLVPAANLLGYALSQDSMMVTSDRKFAGADPTGVITVHLNDSTFAKAAAVYDRLWQLEDGGQKLVGGHSTMNGQMNILNFSGLSNEEFAKRIDDQLGGRYQVDVRHAFVAFPQKADYGQNLPTGYSIPSGQPAGSRSADSLRGQAASLIERELSRLGKAEGGQLAKEFTQSASATSGLTAYGNTGKRRKPRRKPRPKTGRGSALLLTDGSVENRKP